MAVGRQKMEVKRRRWIGGDRVGDSGLEDWERAEKLEGETGADGTFSDTMFAMSFGCCSNRIRV